MVFPSSAGSSRIARRVGWALTLALVVLLIQSTFRDDRVPSALKFGVAAVAVLSAWHPGAGLLVVAGVVPFGHVLVTSVWQAYPFALSEALVLAFFAGYLWRQRRETFEATAPPDPWVLPSRLFALVVLASSIVQVSVLQVWHDYPLTYATRFFEYLVTQYLTTLIDPRPWVDGRGFVWTAATLLEGVGLLRCASALCRRNPGLAPRLTSVMVMAGVGVASLSFYESIRTASGLGQPLLSMLAIRRGSPAIPSIDTAGPYFMLLAFVAIGTAAAFRAYRLPGLAAAAINIGGMWLTQTRSAIVAGFAVIAAVAVWLAMPRRLRLKPSRAIAVAGVVAIGIGCAVVALYVFASGPTSSLARLSLRHRFLFGSTALRMIQSHPFFGVGVGQYELTYPEFASPELLAVYPNNNAHNYFLWTSAELGLAGVALLLWILGATCARCWSQMRGRQNDWFLGVFAGLAAFVITWIVGQPLGVPQVAYTFWIMLGLLAGYTTNAAPAAAGGRRQPLLTRLALAATILLVVGSVPIRAGRDIANIDLSRVSYGFHDASRADDRDFRWAGPRITFFMRRSVRAITVPMAAKRQDIPPGAQVDILVDGRTANSVTLGGRDWHDVGINAPVSEQPYWRVDLHVTPLDIPDSLPESRRRVAVGEISITRRQEAPEH